MLGPEADDEAFVSEVAGIALQHRCAVARGDKFNRTEAPLFEQVGSFLQVAFEVGKAALGIVRQERIGR